jgi:hypothetical protein
MIEMEPQALSLRQAQVRTPVPPGFYGFERAKDSERLFQKKFLKKFLISLSTRLRGERVGVRREFKIFIFLVEPRS